MVDDVIYVFGGRDVNGKDLGDLAAFRTTSKLPCPKSRRKLMIRSTMVHVPKYGSGTYSPIWACDGCCSWQGVCGWWRSKCVFGSWSG